MNSRSKKWLLVAAALLVLGYLGYRSSGSLGLAGFSGAKLWLAIKGTNPFWLGAAMLVIYGCYAVRSLRWEVFQKNLGHAKFWEIYPSTLAGFSAVFLLGRAGEPIRPLLLAKRAKLPLADIFGIWVLERLFDVASMAVIAAMALLVFNAQRRRSSNDCEGRAYGRLSAGNRSRRRHCISNLFACPWNGSTRSALARMACECGLAL
jgi:uncharacterized protein (TIRG00374 family)